MNVKLVVVTIALMVISGCTTKGWKGRSDSEKIAAKLTEKAEQYAATCIKEGYERKITATGNIMLYNSEQGIVIEKLGIKTGLIDDDKETDAIVTILYLRGNYITGSGHLIFLNVKNDPVLAGVVESDMSIISINDRIITARVPTHPRSSPLFNCESCQEIIEYRFIDGKLLEAGKN